MKYKCAIPVPENAPVIRVRVYGRDDRENRRDHVYRSMDASFIEQDGKLFLALHKSNREIAQSHLVFVPGEEVHTEYGILRYIDFDVVSNPVLEIG